MAYVNQLQRDAIEAWRHDMLVWASIAPHSKDKIKAPTLPAVVRPHHGD